MFCVLLCLFVFVCVLCASCLGAVFVRLCVMMSVVLYVCCVFVFWVNVRVFVCDVA